MDHDDWSRGRRDDHLSPPPEGYEWREIDGRFVLGVIANGIVAGSVLNPR